MERKREAPSPAASPSVAPFQRSGTHYSGRKQSVSLQAGPGLQELKKLPALMAEADLLDWIKKRVALPGYTPSMWSEEHDVAASSFLLDKSTTKLLMYMDKDIGLCLHPLNMPLKKVKRLQYFLKPQYEVTLNIDNITELVQYGVTSGAPMESLLKLMNSVYLPTFLKNDTWPEGVKKEFAGQLHKFMASLTETANQLKGHTILYFPSDDLSDTDRVLNDKDLMERLEITVIHWARQIKEVVSNPEMAHHMDNTGPLEEIEVWRSRTVDLSGISEQLNRPEVKRIMEILKIAGSSYVKDFDDQAAMIQTGSNEANSNLKFLTILQKPCERLAQAAPDEITKILPEILNLIRVIWTISKYYNTPDLLAGLLRKVSNQIIIQCSKKIDLNEIFDGDVEASMVQLRESIKCGEAWRACYMRTVHAIQQDTKMSAAQKWNFDPSTHGIFAQIDAFVQRCANLIEVCEGQLQFARKSSSLPRGARAELPAFGGTRGAEIEKSLYEIEEAFDKYVDGLRNLDYDILNVKAVQWHTHYEHFKSGLKGLEVMMSNVISSAWEGVSTVPEGVQLLESFYHLAVRGSMKLTLEAKTIKLYQMFKEELKKVKATFERGGKKKDPPLPLGQPRCGGAALWAKSLLLRINRDYKALSDAAHYLAQTSEAEEATMHYQQLVTVIEGYMRQMHSEWSESLGKSEAVLADGFDRKLIVRSESDAKSAKGQYMLAQYRHLESNFDPLLLRMFNETRFWNKFHGDFNVPYNAREIFAQENEYRERREYIMLVVRDWNNILDSLSSDERKLFSEHLRRVERQISPGINKLTWKGNKEQFVQLCRAKCSALMDIVLQFKDNDEKIAASCSRIASCTLVEIVKNQMPYDEIVFEQNQMRHHERVKAELQAIHETIINAAKASYKFFADHPKEVQKEWIKYVRGLDQKVEDALRATVKKSLLEMSRAINGETGTTHPLFRMSLVLDDAKCKVQFRPTLMDLRNLVSQVIGQSITVIQVVPRLTEVLESAQLQADGQVGVQFSENGEQKGEDGGAGAGAAGSAPASPAAPSAERLALSSSEKPRGATMAAIAAAEKEAKEAKEAAAAAAEKAAKDAKEAAAVAAEKKKEAPKDISFCQAIINENDIMTMKLNIDQGCGSVGPELGKRIAYYDRYAPIYNTDKAAFIRRYANTKRHPSSFDVDINKYKQHQGDILAEDQTHNVKFIHVDFAPLKASLANHCVLWYQKLTALLHVNSNTDLRSLHEFFTTNTARLQVKPESLDQLHDSIRLLEALKKEESAVEERFNPVEEGYRTLDKYDAPGITDEERALLDNLRTEWAQFQQTMAEADAMLKAKKIDMQKELEDNLVSFNQHVLDTRTEFKDRFKDKGPFSAPLPGTGAGDPEVDVAFQSIAEFHKRITDNRSRAESLKKGMEIFGIPIPEYQETEQTYGELLMVEKVWSLMREWLQKWATWKNGKFSDLSVKDLDNQAQTFQKTLQKSFPRGVKQWKVWRALFAIIQQFRQTMPLITDLRSPAMRPRHWEQLREEIQQQFDPDDKDFTLGKVTGLGIHLHADAIHNIAQQATRELAIENSLKDIAATWELQALDIQPYKGNKYFKLMSVDEVNDNLEQHQLALSSMKNSPYFLTFQTDINHWVRTLGEIGDTLEMFVQTQRQWSYLESIFIDSFDIRVELPSETTLFESINKQWVQIMLKLNKTKKALDLIKDGLLDRLSRIFEQLEKINHEIRDYLDKKRRFFPRFYFLSDPDLLEILGNSRDPERIQKHIHNCFAGIYSLELETKVKGGQKTIEVKGMNSSEGENVQFNSSVTVEGEVEFWMTGVEKMMRESIQKQLNATYKEAPKATTKRALLETWVKSNMCQVLTTSGQIAWTGKCTAALNDQKDKKAALTSLRNEWIDYLGNKLAKYVRNVTNGQERLKLQALITVELHARDVISELLDASKKGKVAINSFEWTRQLRYYHEKPQGTDQWGRCQIRQTNTKFAYGYEYQGNVERMVITPLTDRCFTTLTTALSLNRGGNPQGPAGTGKTETVKELGKALGKYVLVFNCGPEEDVGSVGSRLAGLVQTGAWGCFDEFNRITIEVLSVVALQIGSILNACREGVSEFLFERRVIPIDRTVGIFVTMNPGYAGRTELPENLQSMLRPVAMMVPDSQKILEVHLQSNGFKDAAVLSRKIISAFDLMQKQLSKQHHYNYGLRSMKAVSVRAAKLNKGAAERKDESEERIVMRAITDMSASKLVHEDAALFDSMMSELFPSVDPALGSDAQLKAELEKQLAAQGLQVHDYLVGKIMQLYQTQGTRHGNMLVGEAASGKSTAWRTLQKALTALSEQKGSQFQPIEVHILNPQAIDVKELYGYYHPKSREWCEGIFTAILKDACRPEIPRPGIKWILLDGPVDTLWIESMNTLLDDTKTLTPLNNDRISLTSDVTCLFEVQDLAVASPATVSRCGMVYMDKDKLGWKPFVTSWIASKFTKLETKESEFKATSSAKQTVFTKEAIDLLNKLFEKYVVPVLNFRRTDSEVKELIAVSDFNAVQSLTRLFDSLATVDNGIDHMDEAHYFHMIEKWFTFCCIWSCGGAFDETSRKKLDGFIRDLEAQFPPLHTCYEYFVDASKKDWVLWDEKVNNGWRPIPHTPFFKIMVPTIDSVRYQYILNSLMATRQSTIVVGLTGTGKSSIIHQLLEQVDAQWLTLILNFSYATTSEGLQEMIESRLDKRQGRRYGPTGAKARLVTFIDDLNMPRRTEFGSQPPNELLRQWIDYGFWYDRKASPHATQKIVMDMQLLAAMAPPEGARAPLCKRFQGKFNLINFTFPADAQIKRIYRTLLANHLINFEEGIKQLAVVFTQATLDLYKQVQEVFRPVPACPHYLFNMRDMSKVIQGLLQSDPKYYDTKEAMVRLWVHECLRVFHDRLVSEDDRDKLIDIINTKLSIFETSWKRLFKESKKLPMFADFLEEEAPAVIGDLKELKEDEEERAPYVEVSQKKAKVKKFMEDKQKAYDLDPDSDGQDLVLFDQAIAHVIRVYRIITQPRGSALLIGVGGSGRQSLTRLAAFIAGMKCKQIKPTKSYLLPDFREDLKQLYRQTGVKQEKTVFLLSDTQITDEAFLEDVNNILNSGEVPKLFPQDELTPLLEELREEATAKQRPTTQDALYLWLIERVRTNLHVVLAMSPIGADFRNRVRMFPALVNCTTIDWYSDWQPAALKDVAFRFINETECGGKKNKEALAQVFTAVHTSVIETSTVMQKELNRTNYVTPTKYLDLVKSFHSLLNEKRMGLGATIDKQLNGIRKLDEGSGQVKAMKVQLEEKYRKLKLQQQTCDKLMLEIGQKKRSESEQKKLVEVDTVRLEDEEKSCKEEARSAQEELDKVMPALERALKSIDKLSKSAITEVKTYLKPPKPVERVMSAVMVILDKEPTWASAKKELSDPGFLHKLKDFVQNEKDKISNTTLKQIGKYTKQADFNSDDISTVSLAAGALCDWVIAMEQYAKVFRDVEPKRIKYRQSEAKLKKKQEEVEIGKQRLAEISKNLQQLEAAFKTSEAEKDLLEQDSKVLETKLDRAVKLVDGLSDGKVRWESSIKTLENDMKHLLGDCVIGAAFVTYAGPFTSNYREDLIRKHWIPAVRRMNLPYSSDFDFVGFLSEATDVMDWNIQGLPSDTFSTENGILVHRSNRWPLMVDPQGQANMWVKAMFPPDEKRGTERLLQLDTLASNFAEKLADAVSHGVPVLIQDIGLDLHPMLDSLMGVRNLNSEEDKKSTVFFGDKGEINYHPGFRLFLTTKIQNPHFKPEVCIKTTIVNFAVKEKGLQDQLLSKVVSFEEQSLESEKIKTVRDLADGRRLLVNLEDEILSLLKKAGENLLDDEVLIKALQKSKSTSEDVKKSIEESKKNEQRIDEAREAYRPCAVRASICFFVLNDLALVDPMYQFSLKSYIDLFVESIKNSKDERVEHIELKDRIAALNNYHTLSVYNYTCMALFEKHKLLFAFQLCVQRMRAEGKIDDAEYDFFLRGGQVIDRSLRPPKSCDWLSDVAWDNITELDKLPAFKNLAHSFEQNSNEWRAWYRSEEVPPEQKAPPGEWQNKRDEFQQMLILRCLRPDRVVFAARHFIAQNLGAQFVESPPLVLSNIFKVSRETTPLIFVLSPGADPSPQLVTLSKQVGATLEVRALGQGQAPLAAELIARGAKEGFWVYLANCHLSISWLPELEKIVERIQLGKPHPAFRLWLSSDPHPKFPISLLQSSIKMTTEPPRGIRANLYRRYKGMTDEDLKSTAKPQYRKLLFALSFFHSVVVERRKFLSLGWNVPYAFNDADFDTCNRLLRLYLDEYPADETPWDALKYLIAECNYGGRVTDAQDRRLLKVYIDQYFQPAAVSQTKFQLSSLDGYYIPEDGNMESYMKYITSLPKDQDPPEAFGQHPNADIASQMEETKTLLGTILSLQPRIVTSGGKSREETVLELCAQLAEQVPAELDAKMISRKNDLALDKSPLTTVLLQEVGRYNTLLATVQRTLHDLGEGIKGILVISPELEQMLECLYNNQVPPAWQEAYPSVKPLARWMTDLGERIAQLRKWAEDEAPKIFWLGGLTFPTGFLTALLQMAAPKLGASVDTLSWDFPVMSFNESSITMRPREGAYIRELYLEGARWDSDNGCLAEPNPMELFSMMPIVHFKPVAQRRQAKSSTKGFHSMPLYMYPIRASNRDPPSFIMEVDLKHGPSKTNEPMTDFWTKRGVALLLSLDH